MPGSIADGGRRPQRLGPDLRFSRKGTQADKFSWVGFMGAWGAMATAHDERRHRCGNLSAQERKRPLCRARRINGHRNKLQDGFQQEFLATPRADTRVKRGQFRGLT
jgi:hypothetical protein